MKTSNLFLVASAALNFALLGVFIAGGVKVNSTRVPAPKPAAEKLAPAPAAPPTWAELRTTDLAAERDRLRQEGFPPAMIRAILAAEIREQFAERRRGVDAAMANQPFWKNSFPDPQLQAQVRELAKAEQAALKELIGPDPEFGYAGTLHRQFPGWSDDQIAQIGAIRERYDEMRNDMYNKARTGGTISFTPEEREKIGALEKAMHAEFAAVLSPQDLEDYDLRMSNTANNIRYNTAAFDLTEPEFRSLYKLQSAFDEQWSNMYSGTTQEQMRARSDAYNELQKQIAAALGTARYEEYQRGTDYNYRQTTQLVARLELPPETANQLYAVQKDIEQRRRNMFSGGGATSPDDRNQQLAALQQEAIARITPLLGGRPSAVEAYKQYGGNWMAMLTPPRPATPTAGNITTTSRVIVTTPGK